MASWDEAVRCPKCDQPGDADDGRTVLNREGKRVKVHKVWCRNQLCIWLDTFWLVQINPDGTIPDAYSQLGPKAYPKLSPEMETNITRNIEEQLRQETRSDGSTSYEIRKPLS